jgi:hypothetical protein
MAQKILAEIRITVVAVGLSDANVSRETVIKVQENETRSAEEMPFDKAQRSLLDDDNRRAIIHLASVSPELPRPWIRALKEASGSWRLFFQDSQLDPEAANRPPFSSANLTA